MKALVVSLILQGSLPSIGTAIYGLIGFGVLVVGLFLIAQSILSWRRSHHPKEKETSILPPSTPPIQTEAKPEIPLIMSTAQRGLSHEMAQRLDPEFSHVYAVFFYPEQVSWEKAERNPHVNMPRFKAVVNTTTMKAFWMGVFGSDLFSSSKIEYVAATGNSEADMAEYFRARGITLIPKPAYETDLLGKPPLRMEDTVNANFPQTAPEIVVKISPPRLCEPSRLAYLLREKVMSLQVYRCQCLTVKATTITVKSLMAKTWIDDREPYFLNWAPKASDPTSENPKRVDLVREEEAQLPIWYAAKQFIGPEKGYPIQLTLVSDDVFRSVELDRLEKPAIDIAIQFIGEDYTDPKPRHFKLIARPNAETWDELCLTEGR